MISIYYNPTLDKEDLIDRLKKLDYDLFLYAEDENIVYKKINIIIAGSSSLILNGVSIPLTEDIDILKLNSYVAEELLEKYDMNTKVGALEINLPYNYEDRIVQLNLDTKLINYYLLSIEDAVIGKIQAGRGKDWNHLDEENLNDMINWNKLKECALEMKSSLITEEQYKWFLSRYNYYVEVKHHEEAIIENL